MAKTGAGRRPRELRGTTGEDPMVGEMRRAWEQFDQEPGGALGWVVKFAREDPAHWLPGQQESNGCRLLALAHGRVGPTLLRYGKDNIPAPTPISVEETQGELRDFLHQLVTVPVLEGVKVPIDGLELWLVRASDRGKKPAPFGFTRKGTRKARLFHAVAELVLETDRLMACPGPECGEPFLALRKKKFCTSTCLQNWHDAKRPKKGAAR